MDVTRAPNLDFRGSRGLTLVETMGVVVLIALVVATLAPRLAGASESARFRAMIADLRQLDARARLHARTDGPVRIDLDRDHSALRSSSSLNQWLSIVPLPEGASVEMVPATIDVDRSGRSLDYQIELRYIARASRWRMCGLTGMIEASP